MILIRNQKNEAGLLAKASGGVKANVWAMRLRALPSFAWVTLFVSLQAAQAAQRFR